MTPVRFQWLAGIIAAHSNQRIVGRTRLQKEIKLLQRLGLPTDYSYTMHFYGPYSEGLQAEIGILERMGLVEEEAEQSMDGTPYYVMKATDKAQLSKVKRFQKYIDLMEETDATVLELAATYDAFREAGSTHELALKRLRQKKGSKCDDGREEQALELLMKLNLPVA